MLKSARVRTNAVRTAAIVQSTTLSPMGTVLIFIRFLLNLKDPCGLLRSFRPSPRRPLLDRIRIDVNPEDAGPIRRAPAELEHKDGGAGGGHRLLQCKFLEAHVVLVQLKRPQMREAVGVHLGHDSKLRHGMISGKTSIGMLCNGHDHGHVEC